MGGSADERKTDERKTTLARAGRMLGRARRFLARRTGGVALIIALSSPLLIAATGLAVDIGYWYQQQETLQSAADAAAIAAARSVISYGVTTTAGAQPYATRAATNATNGAFNFSQCGGSPSLCVTAGSVTIGGKTLTTYVATAQIPRGSFFSGVKGLGLTGMVAGSQYANAASYVVPASGSYCLHSTGTVTATGGGANIIATNCGVYAGTMSNCALSASGSADIAGTTVSTRAASPNGACVDNSGSSISTNTKNPSAAHGISGVGFSVKTTDQLASFNSGNTPTNTTFLWGPAPGTAPWYQPGTAPWYSQGSAPWYAPGTSPWLTSWVSPSAPSAPSTSNLTAVSSTNFGWSWTTSNPSYGGCSSAHCWLAPNLEFLNSVSGSSASFIVNQNSDTGTVYATNGFSLSAYSSIPSSSPALGISLGGNHYYVSGALSLSSGYSGGLTLNESGVTNGLDQMVVTGTTSLSAGNYPISLGDGQYWFDSSGNGSSVSGTGLSISSATSFTLGQSGSAATGQQLVVTGGMNASVTGALTLGNGTYYITGTTNAAGQATGTAASLTFGSMTLPGTSASPGGPFYINGGVVFTPNSSPYTVSLGYGTYYVNGTSNGASAVNSYALNFSRSAGAYTLLGGTYYLNGGLYAAGPTTIGSGTFYINGKSNNGYVNNYALYFNQDGDSYSLAGGDFYLNGGIYARGTTSFGAGTYYVTGYGTSTGTITGDSVTFNGTSFSTGSGNYYYNGDLNLSMEGTSTISLGSGTTYVNGLSSASAGVVNNWAVTASNPTNAYFQATTMFVNGGVNLAGGTTNVAFGAGAHYIDYYPGNSNSSSGTNGAVNVAQGKNIMFGAVFTTSGGTTTYGCGDGYTKNTYFFNGGVSIGGGAQTVTFCPGIYYIKNGNLVITSASQVTATGATFILEGNAGFLVNGGAQLTMSAPTAATSDCVSTSSAYPLSQYVSGAPYDGTGGYGICGIAIYQARGDSTAATVSEGGSVSITGAVYIPDASLTLSGGASIAITSDAIPTLTVASVAVTASGGLQLTENNSSGGGGGSTNAMAILVQ